MNSLRSALKAPVGIPLPEWLLELGAILIGTETELVMKISNCAITKTQLLIHLKIG